MLHRSKPISCRNTSQTNSTGKRAKPRASNRRSCGTANHDQPSSPEKLLKLNIADYANQTNIAVRDQLPISVEISAQSRRQYCFRKCSCARIKRFQFDKKLQRKSNLTGTDSKFRQGTRSISRPRGLRQLSAKRVHMRFEIVQLRQADDLLRQRSQCVVAQVELREKRQAAEVRAHGASQPIHCQQETPDARSL